MTETNGSSRNGHSGPPTEIGVAGMESLSEPLLSTNDVERNNAAAATTTASSTTTTTVGGPLSNRSLISLDIVSVEEKDIVIRSCFPLPCASRRRRRRRSTQEDDAYYDRYNPHNRQLMRLNHNVFMNLILMITYGISEGLWGGAVFAAYLKQLYNGRNAPIGIIEAAYSIAELIFAVPVGYLADKHGKAKIIRAGAVLFLLTALLHAGTTYWIYTKDGSAGNHATTVLLVLIMALWGIGSGIVDGPCEALFADSTPPGRRTKYYTYLEIFYLLATVVGPLLSLIIFHSFPSTDDTTSTTAGSSDPPEAPNDDGQQHWSMKAIVVIIYAGLAMEALNAVIMMFFDDEKALVEPTNNTEDDESSSSDSDSGIQSSDQEGDDQEEEEETLPTPTPDPDLPFHERYQWTIPYILLTSEIVYAAALGLTDAYFPLFLKDDCGLSPTQVQVLYAMEPLFIAAMTWNAERIAKRLGRIETIVLLSALGTVTFAVIPIFNVRSNKYGILMVLHILTSSFGDSIHPLEEALLADSLPRNQRARWMSLNGSLSGLHQSATAILGGYLSDYWGYRGTFLATCVGETLALGIFALLLLLQPPRRRQPEPTSNGDTRSLPLAPAPNGDVHDPLLVDAAEDESSSESSSSSSSEEDEEEDDGNNEEEG